MLSISFLSVSADKEEKCLICNEDFTKQEKLSSFTSVGSDVFKVQAEVDTDWFFRTLRRMF